MNAVPAFVPLPSGECLRKHALLRQRSLISIPVPTQRKRLTPPSYRVKGGHKTDETCHNREYVPKAEPLAVECVLSSTVSQ